MTQAKPLSASMEDYLERIYDLVLEEGSARVSDVAKRKDVRKASASVAIKKLSQRGFVTHESYETVGLTKKGMRRVHELERRHGLIKRFLTEIVGVPSRIADHDACVLEHHLHALTSKKLASYFERLDIRAHR